MASKYKKGDVLFIAFLDHVQVSSGSSDPLPVKTVGWLLEETKNAFKLSPWLVCESDGAEGTDSYTILKHAKMIARKGKDMLK